MSGSKTEPPKRDPTCTSIYSSIYPAQYPHLYSGYHLQADIESAEAHDHCLDFTACNLTSTAAPPQASVTCLCYEEIPPGRGCIRTRVHSQQPNTSDSKAGVYLAITAISEHIYNAYYLIALVDPSRRTSAYVKQELPPTWQASLS